MAGSINIKLMINNLMLWGVIEYFLFLNVNNLVLIETNSFD